MKNALCCLLVLLAVVSLVPDKVSAQEDEEIEFNIVRSNGDIAVWVNLASKITRSQLEKLRDGIDMVIEYQLDLSIPKRFIGETSVASLERAFRIRYRLATEDFCLYPLGTEPDSGQVFLSYSQLERYLTDSITVRVASLASLDSGKRYALEIRLALITMTELSHAPVIDTTGTDSPLKYLFRQFLSLTAFGRDEYRTKSRAFSLSELVSEN